MISIVIVSFRSTSILAKCLEALSPEIGSGDEVIVVENSRDERVAELREFALDNFTLLINDRNVGYSKGCNQGIEMAVNDQILLLNPDTLPKAGALEALKNLLQTKEKNALYAVELINPDGARQDYYRRFPSVRALLVMFFIPRKYQSRFYAYRRYTYANEYLSRKSFEQPPGAGLVVPKTIQLDEDFFVYGSDLMLSWDFAQTSCQEVTLLPVKFLHMRGQGGTSSSPDLADWLRVESASGFALFYRKSGQYTRHVVWMMSFAILEFLGIIKYLFNPAQRTRRFRRLMTFIHMT